MCGEKAGPGRSRGTREESKKETRFPSPASRDEISSNTAAPLILLNLPTGGGGVMCAALILLNLPEIEITLDFSVDSAGSRFSLFFSSSFHLLNFCRTLSPR